MDARGWLAFLEELADEADPTALRYFRARDLVVEEKPELGPVSEADLAIEEAARSLTSQRHPGLGKTARRELARLIDALGTLGWQEDALSPLRRALAKDG